MTVDADRPAPAGLSRLRLFIVLACLYLAQAIPSYLFAAAIPPILREQGVSRTAIGMMALLMLPLVLKFLWAPRSTASVRWRGHIAPAGSLSPRSASSPVSPPCCGSSRPMSPVSLPSAFVTAF